MDNLLSKEEQEALEQAQSVLDLTQHKAWQEVFQPLLEAKVRHSWVDPREIKDQSDFFYKYVVAWGFSTAANEMLLLIEEMRNKRDFLQKKKDGEQVNNFKIGG